MKFEPQICLTAPLGHFSPVIFFNLKSRDELTVSELNAFISKINKISNEPARKDCDCSSTCSHFLFASSISLYPLKSDKISLEQS